MKFRYLLLIVLLGSNVVLANVVEVKATGVVDTVQLRGRFGLDGSVIAGSVMTATYLFDSGADPISTSDHDAIYGLISVSLNVGNYIFTHNPGATDPAEFRVTTSDPGYNVYTHSPYFEGTIYANGVPKKYNNLIWDWNYISFTDLLYGNAPDATFTDELPTSSFRDLSLAIRKEFRASFFEHLNYDSNPNAGYFNILGHLTSVEIVPEPATLSLLALGIISILRKKPR